MITRPSAMPTGYWLAYTDPSLDVDVSSQFSSAAVFERHISWVW